MKPTYFIYWIFFRFFIFATKDFTCRKVILAAITGMWLGFCPVVSLQWHCAFLIVLFIRVNVLVAMISTFFFSAIYYIVEYPLHKLGVFLLRDQGFLQGFWTWLYHAPIAPFTLFNQSTVAGSLFFLLIASPVFYILGVWGYKAVNWVKIFDWFLSSRFWLTWTQTPIHRIYIQNRYRET